MKRLVMGEIKTPKPTRYVIEGSWILRVPDFTADPEYENMLTGLLMPKFRHDAHKARTEARARIDGMGRSQFLHGVREFIVRTAIDYGRRFPMKIRPDRTLDGFDPAKIAELYVPYATAQGRQGRTDVRNLLVRMGK